MGAAVANWLLVTQHSAQQRFCSEGGIFVEEMRRVAQ
jgi:hypothetical protein